jgi:cellulase/cellobiase CelA1
MKKIYLLLLTGWIITGCEKNESEADPRAKLSGEWELTRVVAMTPNTQPLLTPYSTGVFEFSPSGSATYRANSQNINANSLNLSGTWSIEQKEISPGNGKGSSWKRWEMIIDMKDDVNNLHLYWKFDSVDIKNYPLNTYMKSRNPHHQYTFKRPPKKPC